jgi:hypothetical protein
MGEWLAGQLESLGATVERVPLGKQTLEGQELDLPPALMGSYGSDPKKKTVSNICTTYTHTLFIWCSRFCEEGLTDILGLPMQLRTDRFWSTVSCSSLPFFFDIRAEIVSTIKRPLRCPACVSERRMEQRAIHVDRGQEDRKALRQRILR